MRILFVGPLIPLFWKNLVMSPLGFKARVGSALDLSLAEAYVLRYYIP